MVARKNRVWKVYRRRERERAEHGSLEKVEAVEIGGIYAMILDIVNHERNKGRRKVREPEMQGMGATFF